MKNTLSGNEGRGFMKILVAADTDTVVGVHLIGPETAEIIQVRCRHGHSTHAHVPCPTSMEPGAAPAFRLMPSDAKLSSCMRSTALTRQGCACMSFSQRPVASGDVPLLESARPPRQLSLLAAHRYAPRWP